MALRVRAADTTIAGLRFAGNSYGIHAYNAPGLLVESNVFTDNAMPIEVQRDATGTAIRHNHMHDNRRDLDNDPNVARGGGGATFYYTYGPHRFEHNVLERNPDVGIELYGQWDLTIANNQISGSYDAIETGVDRGGTCGNTTVIQNTFANSDLADGREEHGIWWRCGQESTIAHNTFASLDRFMIGIGQATEMFGGPLHDLRIEDNVFRNGRAYWIGNSTPHGLVVDGNTAYACTSGTCPAFGGYVAQVAGVHYTTHCAFTRATGYDATTGCAISAGYEVL